MIAATPSAMAYSLAAYLASAEIVDSTASPTARASTKVEEVAHVRSYAGSPSWNIKDASVQLGTAQPENPGLVVGDDRYEDRLVTLIAEFFDFDSGWDGEEASKPVFSAIVDAIRFVRAAGSFVSNLEPTLHVDGSIILEVEDGSAGSLRFKGDGAVIFALDGAGVGSVLFDGYAIPEEIKAALKV